MSIVIQLFNGSPKKKKGEKMAGLILTRDPELGFRMKVQALPTRREIHRLVSDCPLAITEQTLLWLQRHKWQWKLHPNSLDVRELLKQVKTYTNLLPPEHISDACDLLLSNFRQQGAQKPRKAEPQRQQQRQPQQAADPTAEEMRQQMIMMQRQMMAMQQQMQQGAPVAVPSDPISAKLQRTQQRHAETMAHVNAVAAANEAKRAMQEEIVENIDEIVAEVDALVSPAPAKKPSANIIQDEELSEEVSEELVADIEVPEFFKTPQDAWNWAMELEVFDSIEEAAKEYESLKNEEKPKTAKEMATLWTTTCLEIFDLLGEMGSDEDEEEYEESDEE